jgi:hypothetical protein
MLIHNSISAPRPQKSYYVVASPDSGNCTLGVSGDDIEYCHLNGWLQEPAPPRPVPLACGQCGASYSRLETSNLSLGLEWRG